MDQVTKALKEIRNSLTYFQALKELPRRQLSAERRLSNRLKGILLDTEGKMIEKILEMGRVPGDMEQRVIDEIFRRSGEDFAEAIIEEGLSSASYGRNRTISELQRQGSSISFSDFDQRTLDLLRSHAFEASTSTLDRMRGNVMEVISQGYEEGLGIRDVAENLHSVFENMEGYETERIARTEINSMQNEGAELTEIDLGVEFHQWITAEDERVREEIDSDHVALHGQIVKVGDLFSNGLERPGDKDGPIAEWINCRCRLAPFLMPEGKRPPTGQEYFYEWDLVDVA